MKISNSSVLIAGIIAGATAMHLLKSKKGQEVVNLLMEKGDELKSTISDQSEAIISSGKKLVENARANGVSILETTAENISALADHAEGNMNDPLKEFKNGAKNAKKRIENSLV